MVHLSNPKTIGIMIFYSIITYIIGPLVTRPFMGDHPDQCIAGFLLGFTISIFLWMKFGIFLGKIVSPLLMAIIFFLGLVNNLI